MAKTITAIQWLDRLHLLTTFAVCLAEEEERCSANLGASREIPRDALIDALGLEEFSSTSAIEAFEDAFTNREPYRAARAAIGDFQPIPTFTRNRNDG